MLIVEVRRGLDQPVSIIFLEPAGSLFLPSHQKRRSAWHSSFLKANKSLQKPNNTSPTFLTLATRRGDPGLLPCSTAAQQCCCCCFSLCMLLTACATQSFGQPHFTSFEYLWMLLSGHIPLSGRLPGMGLPILSPCTSVWKPCTSSNCSLHFTVHGCHQCCWCYGEKWEATHGTGGKGDEQGSQENLYRRKTNGFSRLQSLK